MRDSITVIQDEIVILEKKREALIAARNAMMGIGAKKSKRRGRPAGSRNKKKTGFVEQEPVVETKRSKNHKKEETAVEA